MLGKFNTSIGGIVAHEIKLSAAIGFSFSVSDGTTNLVIASDGQGDVIINDGAKETIVHQTGANHSVGIELDLDNDTYNIFHEMGGDQSTVKSGTIALDGDCEFFVASFAGMDGGKASHVGFNATYAAGAKNTDNNAIV